MDGIRDFVEPKLDLPGKSHGSTSLALPLPAAQFTSNIGKKTCKNPALAQHYPQVMPLTANCLSVERFKQNIRQ